MKRLMAMVLAGGKGTRMDILCHGKAKPTLPFGGRFRVIDFTLSNCINSGIEDIGVLVDYQRQAVASYVARSCFLGESHDRLRVLEPKEASYSGTADAVFQNLDYLQKGHAEAVLVLAGDHVYRMDYREMLRYHEEMKADATVGVVSVPLAETHRFGIVTTDGSGRIVEFIEKPQTPVGDKASMGIYIFDRDYLSRRLSEDASDSESAHDFGRSIVPSMVQRDRVFAYEFSGYWQDIGTVAAYYAANMELTRESPGLCLNGGWPVLSADLHAPAQGPQLLPGGMIRHSLVSPGCIIEGVVENSILSPGVRVEGEAVVKNSVIMGNSVIGRQSVVDHCIVDEQVTIGRGCYIGFGADPLADDRHISVLGSNVTVPPFTNIDCNCKVLPSVGPEDFTTRVVRHGSVVAQLAAASA
ncbi:MAG: NTP transferase domain-containing protein [Chloroflexi bacterium]|nr:NTP transferase domain-containing protein [Chloroflexota bacterium]